MQNYKYSKCPPWCCDFAMHNGRLSLCISMHNRYEKGTQCSAEPNDCVCFLNQIIQTSKNPVSVWKLFLQSTKCM